MDILTDDLESDGIRISPSGRVSYPEKYSAYAEKFGKSIRTIRDWVAFGKKVGSIPPLHDPTAMVGWWKSHKRTRVPQVFLDLSFDDSAESSEKVEITDVTRGDDDEKKRIYEPCDIEGGAEESLRQARELAHGAYEKLKNSDNPGEAEGWRKDWTSAVETQRKWEKDYNRIQEERGRLVRKSQTQVELALVANVLQRGFLASLDGVLKRHTDLPQKDRRKIAVAERDKCFEVLQSGHFSDSLFPELAE